MRFVTPLALSLFLAVAVGEARAQRNLRKDAEFVKSRPTVGDSLPARTVFTPDGGEFDTGALRGQISVLTFGCLT